MAEQNKMLPRWYVRLLRDTMSSDRTNRNTLKFQKAYNIYRRHIGIEDDFPLKEDAMLGPRTESAGKWFQEHDTKMEDDIAFDKMQKSLSDKRMDFYRNWEFTEPSDTSDVRR